MFFPLSFLHYNIQKRKRERVLVFFFLLTFVSFMFHKSTRACKNKALADAYTIGVLLRTLQSGPLFFFPLPPQPPPHPPFPTNSIYLCAQLLRSASRRDDCNDWDKCGGWWTGRSFGAEHESVAGNTGCGGSRQQHAEARHEEHGHCESNRCGSSCKYTPTMRFYMCARNSRTLLGSASPLPSLPHQCPLVSAASYRIYVC